MLGGGDALDKAGTTPGGRKFAYKIYLFLLENERSLTALQTFLGVKVYGCMGCRLGFLRHETANAADFEKHLVSEQTTGRTGTQSVTATSHNLCKGCGRNHPGACILQSHPDYNKSDTREKAFEP